MAKGLMNAYITEMYVLYKFRCVTDILRYFDYAVIVQVLRFSNIDSPGENYFVYIFIDFYVSLQ